MRHQRFSGSARGCGGKVDDIHGEEFCDLGAEAEGQGCLFVFVMASKYPTYLKVLCKGR